MYLFIFYICVYFIHEVDLRYSSRRHVHDGAAETARLINLVQKIDNFEVRYPSNDVRSKDAEDLEFESMKLLQKNYDIARKFNERVDDGSMQYISNPEVLAAYRNLPEERTEVYDDISDQTNTQRSYVQELERIDKLPIHELGHTRKKNGDITAINSETDDSESDNTDSDESSDDANEETRVDDNRRTKVEDQDSANAGTSGTNSKETKKTNLKSTETFNLLKPIIEQMLSKYTVKESQEKDGSIATEVKDSNKVLQKEKLIIEGQDNNEDEFVKKAQNNDIKLDAKPRERIVVQEDGKDKLGVSKKKKNTQRLSLNRPKKKKKKDVLLKKQHTGEESFTKDDQELTKESASVSEKYVLNPKITIEDYKSEEKRDRSKINKNEKQKDTNSDSEEKKENSNKNENNKNAVEMDETVIDWADYDEGSKADIQHSTKKRKKERSWDSTEKYDKHEDSKKISTRRKGDNRDDEYDNENKKDNSKNKKQDWSKAEDDNWNKKDESWDKKDDRKKKDDHWSKEDDWNKKGDKNKKNVKNKKDDIWDKKANDNWDKKDINWDTKEDSKMEKKKKEDKNDDTGSKKRFKKTHDTPKRDNAWDSVGSNKKQNSGWGNYDTFKNIQDKTNYEKEPEKKKPKVEMKVQRYQSWDRHAARDDYYEKPRKNQGRHSPFRTSVPFVGKKAVYAD